MRGSDLKGIMFPSLTGSRGSSIGSVMLDQRPTTAFFFSSDVCLKRKLSSYRRFLYSYIVSAAYHNHLWNFELSTEFIMWVGHRTLIQNLIYSTTPPPTPRRSTVSTARNTALNVCVDISSLWDSTAIVVQSVFLRKVTLEWSSHQVDWIGISGQTIGRNNIIDSTTELTYSEIPLQWKLFKGAHSK